MSQAPERRLPREGIALLPGRRTGGRCTAVRGTSRRDSRRVELKLAWRRLEIPRSTGTVSWLGHLMSAATPPARSNEVVVFSPAGLACGSAEHIRSASLPLYRR